MIGGQCDRTGPTQIVGVVICPAIQDYIDLINSKGGIEGYKIKYNELDNEYKVPQAVEEYSAKKAGAVSMAIYGTPQVQALNQKLVEDKIPGTSPGFGISASADGGRFPYLFPVAATYWSQGAAAVQFIKDKLGGSLKGKKIAYVYYDNPAGHEPLPILEDLQKIEGSSCGPLPCRRRVWRWAHRCSTSRSVIGPILSSTICSVGRPQWRSRNTSAPAFRCRR